jgi:hypothetical protein
MIPSYAAAWLPIPVRELFERIEKIAHALPNIDLGVDANGEKIIIDCYMVARAFSRVFGLPVVHGTYSTCSHAWLETVDHRWIIDLFPVWTFPGPIIVNADPLHGNVPGRTFYIRRSSRGKLGKAHLFSSREFRRSVRRITNKVKKLANAYRARPANTDSGRLFYSHVIGYIRIN